MKIGHAKGDWKLQKELLKQRFVELTDNDLLFVDDKKEEVLEKLQQKLGKTKAEILKILKTL